MNPIALTIAAALCFAGGFQGRQTEVSSRRPPAVEEPDSPANAIAFDARGAGDTELRQPRVSHA